VRAIVTGAATPEGIGRAVVHRLATTSKPARLLLADVAERDLADAVDAAVAAGADAHGIVADLADPDAPARVVAAALERFDGLDLVVSNAGVGTAAPLADLAVRDFDWVFAVNTRATWLLVKAARASLAASGGCVVATASISADEPTPWYGAYSPSKAALIMLIRQLAYELGPDGIRCNCVSPGWVHTSATTAIWSNPALHDERVARVPLRKVATPDDIAAAICFLAGSDAAQVTGTNLVVDGGMRTALIPALSGRSGPPTNDAIAQEQGPTLTSTSTPD
jgi:NAD(P)-dependent dehydrogenase (short-subunit alcohol dehydrogenase family)